MKTLICPECGKITKVDDLTFDKLIIAKKIKEIDQKCKFDGILWCTECEKK